MGEAQGAFDGGINSGAFDPHPPKAADADDADASGVHILAGGEIIHRGAEVFGIDVGRGDVAWLTAAFAGIGRVKGQGDEAALGHGLGVETRSLLLHGAERSADGQGRQLPCPLPGQVEVRRQRDAVTVLKGHFLMRHLVALGKCLVPFLYQMHGGPLLCGVAGSRGSGRRDPGGRHEQGSQHDADRQPTACVS